jgi:hypothetical protein
MLADFVESVPELARVPNEMLVRIINFLTPLQLIALEMREDFVDLGELASSSSSFFVLRSSSFIYSLQASRVRYHFKMENVTCQRERPI